MVQRVDSKELVYRSLSFENVPRTPYCIDFTVPALKKLRSSRVGARVYRSLKNDLFLTPVIRVEWGIRNRDGRYRDEFGLEWDRSIDADIGLPRPMVTPTNFDQIRWPDPYATGRFDALRRNLRAFPDRFHMIKVDFTCMWTGEHVSRYDRAPRVCRKAT